MTPAQMAEIHSAAFVQGRGWSADEIADLISNPYVQTFSTDHGFALTRTLAGESELLTIAVDPEHQRLGTGRILLSRWIDAITPLAETAFLEVAADNHGAMALYAALSFNRSGLRKQYYARATGEPVDAVLMTRAFTRG